MTTTQKTAATRYTVHIISIGNLGVWEPRETLAHTNDAAEAKRVAAANGSTYHLGTCICDHEARTTDWGDHVSSWDDATEAN